MRWPGLLGTFFLLYLLLLLPLAAWRTAQRLRGSVPGRPVTRIHYWRSAVVSQVFLFVFAYLTGSSFEFPFFRPPDQMASAIGLGAGALAVCLLLREVARRLRSEEERRRLSVFQRSPRTAGEAAWFVAAVICASVAEEAAYRGVGWQLLNHTTGSPWGSAAILCVAFALAHWNQGWKSGIVIAAFAAVFHIVVGISDTLVIAMIVHAVYDLTAGYLIHRQARVYDREEALISDS